MPSRMLFFALLLGCAASPPPTAPAAASPAQPPPGDAAAAPAPANVARVPSEDFRARWVLGDGAKVAVYADFPGQSSVVVTQLLPAALELAQELTAAQRKCLADVVGATREIGFGATDSGSLGVLRFERGALRLAPALCVQALTSGEARTVSDASVATLHGDDVVALNREVLLVGSSALVMEALQAGPGHVVPADLRLQGDQHVVYRARLAELGVNVRGSIVTSPSMFRLDARVAAATEELAQTIEAQAQSVREKATHAFALGGPRLVNALRASRSGKEVEIVFEDHGSTLELVQDVGVASALAIYGLRKYLLSAKMGEARQTIGEIARRERVAAESLARSKRRFQSLPPVPKDVPRGAMYRSVRDDWAAWRPIDFWLSDPQYYQYEVVAAPDGKSVEVIARGDLNGDGKTSLFKMRLKVDDKTGKVVVEPEMYEKDPEE